MHRWPSLRSFDRIGLRYKLFWNRTITSRYGAKLIKRVALFKRDRSASCPMLRATMRDLRPILRKAWPLHTNSLSRGEFHRQMTLNSETRNRSRSRFQNQPYSYWSSYFVNELTSSSSIYLLQPRPCYQGDPTTHELTASYFSGVGRFLILGESLWFILGLRSKAGVLGNHSAHDSCLLIACERAHEMEPFIAGYGRGEKLANRPRVPRLSLEMIDRRGWD